MGSPSLSIFPDTGIVTYTGSIDHVEFDAAALGPVGFANIETEFAVTSGPNYSTGKPCLPAS